MFCIKNNEKNKSAVILNPEAGVKISGASVEPVVNDRAKTKRYSAKRDLYGDFAYAQPLKMTVLALLLSLNLSTSWAEESCNCSRSGTTLTISDCHNGALSKSSCENQKSAENVIIGTGVTSIGAGAFDGATSLTSITIPEGVTSIGTGAFHHASSLTSITIPDSVTSIKSGAFNGASSLTRITIPDSVTSIGNIAFARSSSLTSITLPGSLTEVGTNLFNSSGLTEINCAGTESECDALEILLDKKGYLPEGRTFKRVKPVTKCSSYTSSGCNACYAGYAFGNSSCHACGTGKNCHWDNTAEKVVFDGCKDKYLRKENECIAASQGCGANFRLNDGECDRLRYTPAEAAQVLHNDNTNSVTITFKK